MQTHNVYTDQFEKTHHMQTYGYFNRQDGAMYELFSKNNVTLNIQIAVLLNMTFGQNNYNVDTNKMFYICSNDSITTNMEFIFCKGEQVSTLLSRCQNLRVQDQSHFIGPIFLGEAKGSPAWRKDSSCQSLKNSTKLL